MSILLTLKNNNNNNQATLLVEGSGHVATAGGCVLVKLLPHHTGHRLNVKSGTSGWGRRAASGTETEEVGGRRF